MSERFVVIVDPYSSGTLLVQEFKARGFECLLLQSNPVIPDIYRSSFQAGESNHLILFKGNLAQTVDELRAYEVECVVPGCDLGVALADALGQALGLAGNDPQLQHARVDKFLMIERVREQGLETPRQFRADSLDELLERTEIENLSPVILKPLNSTSSEGVFICGSDEEIRTAYARIMGHTNALGHLNRAVLVQEFLSGTEYVVDTVSYAGVHRAAAFWKYHKSSLATSMAGPECIELLACEGEIQSELFAYSKRVLEALGVRYGAAHIELIWSESGPVLIEIGARVNGGNNPLICRTCTGSSQIELLVDAYLESERFVENLNQNYALHKKGIRVFLIPRCKGQFRNVSALEEMKTLESFHEIYVGSRKSWDSPRRIGWVILVHEDARVVERDLDRIRELEESELYTQ